MPSDAVHVKSAKWIAIISGIILYQYGIELLHIIGIILWFMFCVMYLSPDLDMENTVPSKRWKQLRILWVPFEKMVDHRSRWSHGWIIGFIVIHAQFLLFLSVVIVLLRMFWLPLAEPVIDQCNIAIDNILILNFTPALTKFLLIVGLTALAGYWQHTILDTLLKNKT